MRIRQYIYILLAACAAITAQGQELQCNVTVNSDKIQGSNKQVFETLRTSIEEYINQNRWTNMTFSDKERIECNMQITVMSVAENTYTCTMLLQSRRPVYGASYTSPLINFQDQAFNFTYQEYDRIEFQQSNFSSNLAAMLAYYCYLIIGYDMDSFSRLGGTPYFQICEDIASMCQSASMEETEQTGWLAFRSNRNRYAIINNLMDEAFRKYREYIYTYHRLGLDEMQANVANGRARIANDISVLRDANRARPATYVINTFLDAKCDELVNIFKQGTAAEKKNVYEVLMDIDPTRQNLYDALQ